MHGALNVSKPKQEFKATIETRRARRFFQGAAAEADAGRGSSGWAQYIGHWALWA